MVLTNSKISVAIIMKNLILLGIFGLNCKAINVESLDRAGQEIVADGTFVALLDNHIANIENGTFDLQFQAALPSDYITVAPKLRKGLLSMFQLLRSQLNDANKEDVAKYFMYDRTMFYLEGLINGEKKVDEKKLEEKYKTLIELEKSLIKKQPVLAQFYHGFDALDVMTVARSAGCFWRFEFENFG